MSQMKDDGTEQALGLSAADLQGISWDSLPDPRRRSAMQDMLRESTPAVRAARRPVTLLAPLISMESEESKEQTVQVPIQVLNQMRQRASQIESEARRLREALNVLIGMGARADAESSNESIPAQAPEAQPQAQPDSTNELRVLNADALRAWLESNNSTRAEDEE